MSDLNWEASYAIALALIERYPGLNVEDIGYEQLFHMVTSLPNFADDPELANEGVLEAVLREWYEEVSDV